MWIKAVLWTSPVTYSKCFFLVKPFEIQKNIRILKKQLYNSIFFLILAFTGPRSE